MQRLFLDPNDPFAVEFGNAEALRVRHFLEQDARARGLRQKRSLYGVMSSSRMLSPEDDADAIVVGEILAQPQRVGDPAFAFLIRVVDVLEAELAAVPQQAKKIARRVPAGDDHDVRDPGLREGFERIVDHRLVVHRQQMLIGDFGERAEPRTQASGEDDALHAPLSAYCVR